MMTTNTVTETQVTAANMEKSTQNVIQHTLLSFHISDKNSSQLPTYIKVGQRGPIFITEIHITYASTHKD
jgi:hypothetical protein